MDRNREKLNYDEWSEWDRGVRQNGIDRKYGEQFCTDFGVNDGELSAESSREDAESLILDRYIDWG